MPKETVRVIFTIERDGSLASHDAQWEKRAVRYTNPNYRVVDAEWLGAK